MKIRCPSCKTLYRVDPGRIPAHGIRARCGRCDDIFPVSRAAAEPSTPLPAPTTPTRVQATVPANGPAGEPIAAGVVAAAADRAVEPLAPRAPAAPGSPAFGAQDPDTRARRLARALVSDIVAYHPERRERSLHGGTLREEFREEILKSWEEYVAQVGGDIARDTPYFREALNEILALGQEVF